MLAALTAMMASPALQPSHSDEAIAAASRWTALGDSWWKIFIDGNQHYKGPHVFDGTLESLARDQDGNTFLHLKEEYERFATPHAWESLQWDVDSLEATNARLRGINGTCAPHCKGSPLYLAQMLPRNQSYNWRVRSPLPCIPSDYSSFSLLPSLGPVHDSSFWTATAKRAALERLLSEYYEDVGHGPNVGSSSAKQAGVPDGFSRLAKLYYALAELHPFADANSRTRLLLVHTELVRMGEQSLAGDKNTLLATVLPYPIPTDPPPTAARVRRRRPSAHA